MHHMQCSKCRQEAFLLSTAEHWRRDSWVLTQRFYCGSCGTMHVEEDCRVWEIPVKLCQELNIFSAPIPSDGIVVVRVGFVSEM
jgi:ribosomal protein S27AE